MTFPIARKNVNPAQELDFDQPVVNIGTHPENDIKISGDGVLPFHAMVITQGDAFQLVPLSADATVLVDGQMVNVTGIGITENQPVQIGDYTLAFRRNAAPTSMHVFIAQTGNTGPANNQTVGGASDADSAIVVNALTRLADIQVEQTASYQIEVINAGPIVASFSVRLQGVPAEWVEITPRSFNLNEEQKMTVTIKVTPPRSPDSAAGKHPLTILVTSPNYARAQVSVNVDLIIQPYFQFRLGNLSPKQQNISYRKRVGAARLPITNQGNGEASFNVTAQDEENGCAFDFHISDDLQLNKQASLNIPAGETVTLPIEITPIKRHVFAWTHKRYQFTSTVKVEEQTVTPQIVSGSVTSSPLFGWWSIVLSLLLLAVLIFIMLIPRITSFDVVAGKDVIEQGDTTSLEWNVSPFATNLSVAGIQQAINYGQTSLTVNPTQSITYELTASNYLSGLVGLNQKKSQTVLVVPPSPVINVFEVDNTSVARGKAVKIRYSVTQAETAILNIGGVVTSLTPDKFSGEQSVVLDKDSLVTLKASNASGSELRSYLIDVVEPKVTINTYTVWVRPQAATTSMTPPSAAKAVAALSGLQLMSMPLPLHTLPSSGLNAAIPADSFTEKLVELVPDKTSDSGYRVQFNAPNRQLAKGEQVMIEWNVDGTDSQSLQIAPFTDILPNKGRQPFFPQSSMNFVMTAQSGDAKKIFMLPVVVFDGTPPAAPVISIFQASPTSLTGSGTVQFAWSVSGAWTRIQLANGKGIVADYLNPQGFKKVTVGASDTFILTAWNGTLSAATPINITVNPALVATPIAVTGFYPQTGKFLTGDKISVTVDFPSLPVTNPPTAAPTGKIIISDGVASCSFVLPVKSCDLIFITPGVKSLVASYAGDAVYAQANSAAFDGSSLLPATSIDVAAATVTLTPSYFSLVRPSSPGTEIVDITNPTTPLQVDSGLYIKVAVKPVSTVIPNDNFSHVRLSICDLDSAGNPDLSTCYLMAQAPVVVDTNGGGGNASIVLSNFPKEFAAVGTRAFLFEYRHDNNALLPATVSQNNITINKTPIGLKLAACATDPIQFIGCEVSGTNTNQPTIVFDIITGDGNPLSIDLPQPEALYSVYDDGGNGGNHPWTCTIIQKVSPTGGGNYQLSCIPQLSSYTSTVYFSFTDASSANYLLWSGSPTTQPSSFPLTRKSPTTLSLDAIGAMTVGQLATLTASSGGLAHLLDSTSTQPSGVSANTLHLTFSDPAFVGVPNSSSANCSAANGVLTVNLIGNTCQFYFAKTGTVTVTLSFDGDGNYGPSSAASQTITVSPQSAINSTWKYMISPSTTYNNWDLTTIKPNTPVNIEILLSGPSGFAPESLVGQSLQVPFTLSPGSVAGTCNSYTGTIGTPIANSLPVTVLLDGTGASFTWNCSPVDMHFTLGALKIGDGSSFSFASGQDTAKTLLVADRPTAGLSVSMQRSVDSHDTVGGGIMQTLYAGETYTLKFTVGPLQADAFADSTTYTSIQAVMDYYQNNTFVQINLPASLTSQIDWSLSTCQSSPGAHDLKVPLSDTPIIKESYGYPETGQGLHDIQVTNAGHPCLLAFFLDAPSFGDIPTAGEQATFTLLPNPLYAPNYNNSIVYTASQAYNWQGLERQTVSAKFNPAYFLVGGNTADVTKVIGSASETITMTLAGASGFTSAAHQPFDTSQTYDSQVYLTNPPSSACSTSVLTPGSIQDVNTASMNLVSPSAACSGQMTTTYLGNAWYKSISGSATIKFNNAPQTQTTITAPANGSTYTYKSAFNFSAQVSTCVKTETPPNCTGPSPSAGTVEFDDSITSTPVGGSAVAFSNGTANVSVAIEHSLGAGTHSITASFKPLDADNTLYGTSFSPAISIIVSPAATTTALTSNPDSTNWTTNTTTSFTATVTPQNFSDTVTSGDGTVEFIDSGSGSDVSMQSGVSLNSSGVATYSTQLSAGNHSIRAVFHANSTSNYAGSTSNTITQAIQLPLTLTLSSNAVSNTYTYSQPETYTLQLGYSGSAPTGTVSLWRGTVQIGSDVDASTAVNKQITFPDASLSASSIPYSVLARFAPPVPNNTPYLATHSSALSITVNKATTSITLIPSATTLYYGDSLHFDMQVTGLSSGTADIFMDGSGTPLDTVTISAGAGASKFFSSATSNALEPGTHNFTATFTPNSADQPNYLDSNTASPSTVTINKIATSVTLSASANTSNYGDTIKFNAQTTGLGTGTLQFKDNNADLIDPSTSKPVIVSVAAYAIAELPINYLTANGLPHSITAVFTPDVGNSAHYATSISNTLTQTVNKAPTSITITPSANPSIYGSLTYTISVSAASTATALTGGVGGQATVTYDTNAFSTKPTIDSSGAGSFGAPGLAAGTHSIQATYAPSNSNLATATSAVVYQTVQAATPSIVVSSSANPSTYGSTVTLTATVSPNTASGQVQFKSNFANLGSPVSLAVANNVNSASLAVSTFNAATYSITAVYLPDTANYNGATATAISQKVNQAASTITLASSSPNGSHVGDSVTFTATTTPATSLTQGGSVDFYVDNSGGYIGSSTVDMSTGTAEISTSLTAGSHLIYADYHPGDSPNVSSSTSATITQKVTIVTSMGTLSVTATNNDSPIKKTDTLTLSVTVSDTNSQNPYGTVTFYVDSVATANLLSTVPISSGGTGSAVTYSTTTGGSVGGSGNTNRTIIAVYTPADTSTFSGCQSSISVYFAN